MRRTISLSPLASCRTIAPAARVLVISSRSYAEEPTPFSGAKAEKLGNDKYRFPIETPYAAHRCDGPEQVCETTKEELLSIFKQMTRIRRTETEADKLYKQKEIRGFLHLYNGQEAVLVGLEAALTLEDHIITAYRDHGHLLTRGGTPKQVLAELAGRAAGCSKGKGGSMHMYSKEGNFYGGNGIVGAQVPLGAGIAFSQKYLKTGRVSVSMFGDGAANQGQLFEAYNMAALWKLPAIFLCENNKYGMGTSIERSSASTEYYKRGDYLPGIKIDGMDALAVKQGMLYAADWARNKGPIMVEAETYRYGGHSMSDPGTSYRTREEINRMRSTRDPIEKIRYKILDNDIATKEELKAIESEVKAEVDEAVKAALEAPFLPIEATYQHVYLEDVPVRAVELGKSYVPKQ
jgi:pyruvate dehydrogenase E1 component alpha subunit